MHCVVFFILDFSLKIERLWETCIEKHKNTCRRISLQCLGKIIEVLGGNASSNAPRKCPKVACEKSKMDRYKGPSTLIFEVGGGVLEERWTQPALYEVVGNVL